MPWKEASPVDQRTQSIADFLRDALSITELCALYGVSRKTGYQWIDRYLCQGPAGLEEIDDGIWNVYFGPLRLGRLHERRMRIEDKYGRLYRPRTVLLRTRRCSLLEVQGALEDVNAFHPRMVMLCPDAAWANVSPPHPHFVSLYPRQVFRQKNRATFGPLLSNNDPTSHRPQHSTQS